MSFEGGEERTSRHWDVYYCRRRKREMGGINLLGKGDSPGTARPRRTGEGFWKRRRVRGEKVPIHLE